MSTLEFCHKLAIERCRSNLVQLSALLYASDSFQKDEEDVFFRLVQNIQSDFDLIEDGF